MVEHREYRSPMGIKVYMLIETLAGKQPIVTEAMRALPNVSQSDVVTGPYDVISLLDVPDLNALDDLTMARIHGIDGVVRTTTCISLREA